jgi:Cys-tRNA(Pro) deacylase
LQQSVSEAWILKFKESFVRRTNYFNVQTDPDRKKNIKLRLSIDWSSNPDIPHALLAAYNVGQFCIDANAMARKEHVSETPATQFLRRHGVGFSEHPYEYEEHGGTAVSSRALGVDEHHVVKTLVMQDETAKPLIVLMHGDRKVSTKNLARQIGCKSVEPCKPEVANRHSGFLVGGTSPFGTKKRMPVYVEHTILELEKIYINGGRRGYLVGIDPKVLADILPARTVNCALEE